MSSAAPAYDILAYGTTKAALNQMMVSVAHMLAKKVRVNSVLIGTVMTAGYLRRTIEINVFGTINSCASELSRFVEQERGGVIVNVGSITALTGNPGTPAYVASKHAISGLTRAIAIDYAPYGIRCNSVNMATTQTPMFDRALEVVREKQASAADGANMVRKGLKSAGLIERNSTPWEQAATILFAASRDASNITGALIASDGGWTAF